MIGGYLPETDQFTLEMIKNKEALEVNRNSTNNRQLYHFNTEFIIWTADIPDSEDKYLGLFNISDLKNPLDIGVNWDQLGLQDSVYQVRDLWAGKNLGSFKDRYVANTPAHGAGLYRISK
jgi:hypothetical protein